MDNAMKSGKAVDASVPTVEELRFLTPSQVRQVRAQFGTPVYVYDERTLEAQARTMLAFPNPFGLTVRYSIKACANGAILRLFDKLGLHFDASSAGEAMRAIRARIEPSKVLITAQELPENFGELVEEGAELAAGSLLQLDLYGRRFPGGEVSIRVNPGAGSGAIRRLTSGGSHSSFGIWHQALDEAQQVIARHRLKVKRLHQHVGSGHDPCSWVRIAATTASLAKRFGGVRVINLGGGYPVRAMVNEAEYDVREVGREVVRILQAVARETGVEPRLELEPGTFLVANGGCIVSTVTDVVATGDEGIPFIKLDTGLTEVVRPALYGAPHPIITVPAQDRVNPEPRRYVVAGHCCIAGDVLTTQPFNPEHLAPRWLSAATPGDLVVIERGGGYCSSMSLKNFNSFPEATEVLLRKDGRFQLIRRRQRPEQITENEIIPQDLTG
jgi:diaminopimelate decarboxylase